MSISEIKFNNGRLLSPFGTERSYGACPEPPHISTVSDDHWFDRFEHRASADVPPTKLQLLSDHLWTFSQLRSSSSSSSTSSVDGFPSHTPRSWPKESQQSSTPFAQMWRPVLGGILVLECVTCSLRCVVLRDCVGGFFMFMSMLLGLYAWREDMNITFIRYWGVMSCINGLLDAVVLVDAAAQMPVPLFSTRAPWAYILASVLRVSAPFSQLLGVPLAWFLYKDYEEAKQSAEMEDKWAGTVRMNALVLGVFSGQGQRLGNAWDRT